MAGKERKRGNRELKSPRRSPCRQSRRPCLHPGSERRRCGFPRKIDRRWGPVPSVFDAGHLAHLFLGGLIAGPAVPEAP